MSRPYRHYATPEEREAARKARAAAYYKARRDGTWVRKNRVHSLRIARKLGLVDESGEVIEQEPPQPPPPPAQPAQPAPPTDEELAAREAARKEYKMLYHRMYSRLKRGRHARQDPSGRFVGHVLALMAARRGADADELTASLVGTDAIDFLLRGYRANGSKGGEKQLIRAAANALEFYLDPEHAELVWRDCDVRNLEPCE